MRPELERLTRDRRVYIVAAVLGALFFTLFWSRIYGSKGFDYYDLRSYYNYSGWVDGQGKLYVEVTSDYLLLPNLLFGACRFIANRLDFYHDGLKNFGWLWVTTAWILFVWTAWLIATRTKPSALFLWLSPAPLWFGLFRYEIYIVLLTFGSLFALEKRRFLASSLFLGVLIAMKGYALCLLPCYLVYLFYQIGLRRAVLLVAVTCAPLILENLAVFLYAGKSALTMPYRLQVNRPNGEDSVYSALAYLVGAGVPTVPVPLTRVLQGLAGLGAAAMRPRTFGSWLLASTFAVLGFVVFSAVSSPQFFMWILPMVCLSELALLRRIFGWYSWLTFTEYPVIQFIYGSRVLKTKMISIFSKSMSIADFALRFLLPPIVILLAAAKLAILGVIGIRRGRAPDPEAGTAGPPGQGPSPVPTPGGNPQ
jgi:hypothetical protein